MKNILEVREDLIALRTAVLTAVDIIISGIYHRIRIPISQYVKR